MNRITLLLLLVLLMCLDAYSQLNSFVVEGRVLSKETKEHLPFATVALKGNTRGTICNSKGAFRLVLDNSPKGETLRISYVGYKQKFIDLSGSTSDLVVYLTEHEHQLAEVTVTALSAADIFERAVNKIPDNYYHEPVISKGFYRLTSKRDNEYVHLSEAVFSLYRSKKPTKDLFKLDKMRALMDERAAHSLDLGLRPKAIFEYDVVNTPDFTDLFNKKALKTHTFVLEGVFNHEGKEVYIISFDQNDGVKKAGNKGRFFIDTKTFAFVYAAYGMSPKGIQYHRFNPAYQVLMELFDIHIEILSQEFKITYKKVGEKYYLNHVVDDQSFSMKSTRAHFNLNLDTHVDYLVTELELDNNEPFLAGETLAKGKYIEFQNSAYDSLYWNDYTIILPDSDFNAIAEKIEASNQANETKSEIRKQLKKFPKEMGVRIDSILTFYNKRNLFNGNALIANGDEIVFNGQYNNTLTNNQKGTQFRIGSTTKTFTSMLILQLESEGRLTLSDTIGQYMPNYVHGHVTIEQLLTHQSGIPNFLAKNEYIVKLFDRVYKPIELIESFCSDPLEFKSGSDFQYSNSGYVILAHLIELVTGMEFQDVLREQIFDPLGMKDTFFVTASEPSRMGKGYLYGQPEVLYHIENVIGAGGITSTVEDLLKWSEALENGTLINAEKLNEAFVPRAAYADWEGDYGYGWMLDNFMFKSSKKHEIRYHPGTDLGFYSMFLKQPDEGITIILLSNTGNFPRFEITDLILDELN